VIPAASEGVRIVPIFTGAGRVARMRAMSNTYFYEWEYRIHRIVFSLAGILRLRHGTNLLRNADYTIPSLKI
jgi:hypothetical protein